MKVSNDCSFYMIRFYSPMPAIFDSKVSRLLTTAVVVPIVAVVATAAVDAVVTDAPATAAAADTVPTADETAIDCATMALD